MTSNGNIIISPNRVNTGKVEVTSESPEFTAGFGLQSQGLSRRYRTDLSTSTTIYFDPPENYTTNFVALARHNLTSAATYRVVVKGESATPDHLLRRTEVWGDGFVPVRGGGVLVDDDNPFFMQIDNAYVTGPGYSYNLEMQPGLAYQLVVDIDSYVGGDFLINIGGIPDLMVDASPATDVTVGAGGRSVYDLTSVNGGVIDLIASKGPGSGKDFVIRRIAIIRADDVYDSGVQPVSEKPYFFYGSELYSQFTGSGDVEQHKLEKESRIWWHYFGSVRGSSVEITVDDPGNGFSYLEFGRLHVGAALQAQNNYDFGYKNGSNTTVKVDRLQRTGEGWVSAGAGFREPKYTLSHLRENEAAWFDGFYQSAGDGQDLIVVPFPDATSHKGEQALHCLLKGNHGITHERSQKWTTVVSLQEIGG